MHYAQEKSPINNLVEMDKFDDIPNAPVIKAAADCDLHRDARERLIQYDSGQCACESVSQTIRSVK